MTRELSPLTGEVVRPEDAGYNEARQDNNGRFDYYPTAIVFCEQEEDVQHAIEWAKGSNTPVRIRSGGHNYEALSVANDALVIDLSRINQIQIDEDKQHAWIDVGAKLGDVYATLGNENLTIPGGTCPFVRVGGLTQGGGVGFLHRQMGLTCDSVVAAKIVTADGQLREVTEDSPDHELLWALKGGGGGNFGVVTSFRFKLHTTPEDVTVFSIIWHEADMEAVVNQWIKHAPETDERLTSFFRLYVPEQKLMAAHDNLGPKPHEVTMIGVFLGAENELKDLLAPMLTAAEPESQEYRYCTYAEAVQLWAGLLYGEPEPTRFLVHFGFESSEQREWYKISSAFAGADFNEESVQKMADYLRSSKNDMNFVSLHALGGAVAKIDPAATAFSHRDKKFILQYQAFWTEEQAHDPEVEKENIQWIRDFRNELADHTTGAFINFVDVDVENWQEAYYGENFERLVEVKSKYDPDNLFKFELSIPTR